MDMSKVFGFLKSRITRRPSNDPNKSHVAPEPGPAAQSAEFCCNTARSHHQQSQSLQRML